ncbi:MAG TPA: hypothetical protein VFL47_07020, partial [Flavisolibacter sp.]|nr:hypothetical protein [Flavisolibacter sp.]
MKTSKIVRFALLLLVAGLFYLIVFTTQKIQQNKESTKWVNSTHQLIENIHEIHATLLDIESKVRGFTI